MSSGGVHEMDGICIKDASFLGGGTHIYNEDIMVSPGSQGVWFAVKGTFTAGTVFLEKQMCNGTWQNVRSYTSVADSVEVLPVGAKLRIRTAGVTGGPVVEVLPVGGY